MPKGAKVLFNNEQQFRFGLSASVCPAYKNAQPDVTTLSTDPFSVQGAYQLKVYTVIFVTASRLFCLPG